VEAMTPPTGFPAAPLELTDWWGEPGIGRWDRLWNVMACAVTPDGTVIALDWNWHLGEVPTPTPENRLAAPIDTMGYQHLIVETNGTAQYYRSRVGADSWDIGPLAVGRDAVGPSLAILPDGTLLACWRDTTNGQIIRRVSHDAGESWEGVNDATPAH
jgi:hypothetical protein